MDNQKIKGYFPKGLERRSIERSLGDSMGNEDAYVVEDFSYWVMNFDEKYFINQARGIFLSKII